MKATRNLANYAFKATAMQSRAIGAIKTARMYEGIADRIYDELPGYAKW